MALWKQGPGKPQNMAGLPLARSAVVSCDSEHETLQSSCLFLSGKTFDGGCKHCAWKYVICLVKMRAGKLRLKP